MSFDGTARSGRIRWSSRFLTILVVVNLSLLCLIHTPWWFGIDACGNNPLFWFKFFELEIPWMFLTSLCIFFFLVDALVNRTGLWKWNAGWSTAGVIVGLVYYFHHSPDSGFRIICH